MVKFLDVLRLQVIEALLQLVAHGGEFIDGDDAFVADDAGGRERPGVAVKRGAFPRAARP